MNFGIDLINQIKAEMIKLVKVRNPIQGAQFKRDVKLNLKRGKDMSELKSLMTILIEERPVPSKYKDHPLKGNWSHHRDSHIEPDWLLIYKVHIICY